MHEKYSLTDMGIFILEKYLLQDIINQIKIIIANHAIEY